MTVEQRTFTPPEFSEDLKITLTRPENGNILETPIIPKPKPLTPEQLSVINALRSPLDKVIAQLLVDAREQGKLVTRTDLAAIDIPGIKNRKPISDDEEIDSTVREKRVYNNIPRSLRPKFEPVGLYIINYYHTGTKDESSYALKTQEELPSQEEPAQYRTLKDLASAIGESSPQTVRSRLDSAIRRDPTIKILYLPDRGKSRVIYLTEADFEKTKADIARRPVAKKGTHNNTNNIFDTQDKKGENRKPIPFTGEFHDRPMLQRPPEQIRQELSMRLTNVILSHLAGDCIEELDKNPTVLLENALTNETKLGSVIKEPPEKFLMDKFIERLRSFWTIVDTKPADSVLQKQAVRYCFDLKHKGYTIEKIIEAVCGHFSITIPTSAPELKFPKDSTHF